ncbi:hypothetical protein EAO66_29165 [Klebsiella pneumoniae]|nr:hypothetical protein EAO66_29165 [Klebsiella pneumoniae]
MRDLILQLSKVRFIQQSRLCCKWRRKPGVAGCRAINHPTPALISLNSRTAMKKSVTFNPGERALRRLRRKGRDFRTKRQLALTLRGCSSTISATPGT